MHARGPGRQLPARAFLWRSHEEACYVSQAMIRIRTLLLALGIATCGMTAARADAGGDETWYRVRMGATTVGFTNETRVTTGDGTTIRSLTDLSVSRMGTPLRMTMMIEERCDAEGRFVEARSEMSVSQTGTHTAAVREGDGVRYDVTTAGETRSQRIPWQADAVSQWSAEQRVSDWLDGDGGEVSFKVFDVTTGTFKTVSVVRDGVVTETVAGEERELVRTVEYENDDDVPVSHSLYGADHQLHRTVIRQMGMEITIERVDAASQIGDVVPSFDILRQSMIACDGFPEPVTRVEDVTLRLDLPRPLPKDRDFNGPNQAELERGEDWVVVRLSRDTQHQMSMRRSEKGRFLQPDAYIQSDNERIRNVAESVKHESGESGWELATALAAWVNRHITEKNFEQGFASALEALDSQSGDCTEHALLLCALLRASGIPARPVVGLVYAGDAFGGHMWVEAFVGHWRSLDALDLDGAPVRLRISTSPDGGAVDERDLMRAYSLVGGMHMDVIGFSERRP